MPLTNQQIDACIREILRSADAPLELCEEPLRMRGRAFRFARRPRSEDDCQRPIIGSVTGYEYDPAGILKIHVDVRTFRGLPFTTIDFDSTSREWTMVYGPDGEKRRTPGHLTFL